MRPVLLLALLVTARLAAGACLDDCRAEWGDSGPDYEECVADCGVCGNGDVEGDEDCDDGNLAAGDCCDPSCRAEPAGAPCRDGEDPTDEELCTTPMCDGDGECEREDRPAPDCVSPTEAGASTLRIRDAEDDANDRLLWTWRRGPAADPGDPTAATAFALCVYDETGSVATLVVPAGGRCGAHTCWTSTPNGFRYRDRTHDGGSVTALRLRQGRHGARTVIRLDAAGDLLDLPDLAYLESPLTVQLRRSGGDACWSARYTVPPVKRDTVRRLREKSDAPVPTTTTTTTTPLPTSTSTFTTTTDPGTPTTSTIPGATVDVIVVDAANAPVPDADVTIAYGGAAPDAFDVTDEAGRVVIAGQPIGLPATITAEDFDGRTGAIASPGFAAGTTRVTVTVH